VVSKDGDFSSINGLFNSNSDIFVSFTFAKAGITGVFYQFVLFEENVQILASSVK
jgi:hypothetical protein